MAINHVAVKVPGNTLAAAEWNANHSGTAEPDAHAIDGAKHTGVITDTQHGVRTLANAHSHADLSNVTSDQHHARSHAITSTSDHTSTATSGRVLQADANGLPVNATNTNADVADAVTKKHSQNTDTALGSGCEALDHGAAATDMVVNVCYGTGDPPAANTTTEGSLFVKYTA